MSDKFYDEFYRQRRNLILISVVICFVLAAELSWSKVSIWGNELNLNNPDGFVSFLWVIWAYWVWRFGVYCLGYEEGFFKSLEKEVLKKMRNIHDQDKETRALQYMDGVLSRSEVSITYDFFNGYTHITHPIKYSGLKFYKFVIPVFITAALSHKSFNDQVFPFLVALLPVVYVAFR